MTTKTDGINSIKCTNGIENTFVGKDGIKRIVRAVRWNDDSTQITFVTFWYGEEKEPAVTSVRIGTEMFNVLMCLMNDFALNYDHWKMSNENKGEN